MPDMQIPGVLNGEGYFYQGFYLYTVSEARHRERLRSYSSIRTRMRVKVLGRDILAVLMSFFDFGEQMAPVVEKSCPPHMRAGQFMILKK